MEAAYSFQAAYPNSGWKRASALHKLGSKALLLHESKRVWQDNRQSFGRFQECWH